LSHEEKERMGVVDRGRPHGLGRSKSSVQGPYFISHIRILQVGDK
jgi:hypothetical protein